MDLLAFAISTVQSTAISVSRYGLCCGHSSGDCRGDLKGIFLRGLRALSRKHRRNPRHGEYSVVLTVTSASSADGDVKDCPGIDHNDLFVRSNERLGLSRPELSTLSHMVVDTTSLPARTRQRFKTPGVVSMNWNCRSISLLLVVPVLLLAAQQSTAQPTAREIMKRADELTRGETAQGTYTMTVVRPDWERTMVFAYWSEGTEKSFIRVEEPVKDRGVSFLKVGREMWQYVPRINRVIKIPPSMMLQSWMGSDFTNDDLVKESSVVDDYEHTLLAQEELYGFDTYKIELVPKPETAVAWDKLIEWIRVDDYVPLRAEYYSERGELVRTMLFGDIKRFGDRVIPARYELVEEKKEGRRTILQLDDAVFDKTIPGSVFTQRNLRRSR